MTEITYDVFISHAFEDKREFTNMLAQGLKERGLKVWYSGFDLKMGDSIMTGVNKALKSSKYAVVVISPIYLEKTYAMNELKALFAQEADHKRILPILHHITMDAIKKHLPLMADRYAISSESGLNFITNKIIEVVIEGNKNGNSTDDYSTIKKKTTRRKISPLNPVLLPLEAQRIMLEKMFPNLKKIFKNRNGL